MNGLEALAGVLDGSGICGEIWVNGSFLTEKIDAKDVDVVLRLDSESLAPMTVVQRRILDWWESDCPKNYGCDTYLFVEFPDGHPNHSHGEKLRRYWLNWFGHSRRGVPKGIATVRLPLLPSRGFCGSKI